MKPSVLDHICCPCCEGGLRLTEATECRGEISEGSLRCADCGSEYPVVRYVPRLVPPENYSRSWGKLWLETGGILRDSFTGMPFHHNVVHGEYDESGTAQDGRSPFGFAWPTELTGEQVLEVGPGTGNCTEVLVETGAEVLSVDMSDAIDTLPEELLTRENLHVVQADITSGAIAPGRFDRVWMFQVLQHTPQPPETLAFVRRFLAPGGELAVTSYSGSFDPWYYRYTKRIGDRLAWRLTAAIVPAAVRVKRTVLRSLQRLRLRHLARLVSAALAFIDPRDVYSRALDGQLDDYLFGHAVRQGDRRLLMKYVIVSTYDAITPTYTNCCPDAATMERWLDEAGYSRFEVWGEGGLRARAWLQE